MERFDFFCFVFVLCFCFKKKIPYSGIWTLSLYTVGEAMQVLQGRLCSRSVCVTYGFDQYTLIVFPAFCQAPWCQKEDHTLYSKRLQSIKEIMHRPRIRKRAGEERHRSTLAAGIQKRKTDQERLNGGSELGLSHEQSSGLKLQEERRSTF